MRFNFLFLALFLFTSTLFAQVAPPSIPAPDSITVFFPTYKAATEGSERSTVAYRMPNGTKYPVFVSVVGYDLFCLAYDKTNGFYKIPLNAEAAAGAN